jgi:hypothetical protein
VNEFCFSIYLIFPVRFKPLGFTQPVTEISTKLVQIMFLGSKARPVHKADNLTATFVPTVWTMCDPQLPTTL